MRCREARRAVMERGAGTTRTLVDSALRDHLDRCSACAAEERLEGLLRQELAALRDEPLPAIDVRGDVMERVRRVGRVERDEVPARQLGWAVLIAAVWVVALLGGMALLAPKLPALFEGTRELGRALGGAVTGLFPVLITMLALPIKLAGVAVKMLGAFGPLAGRLQPLGQTAVALCYVVMAATVTMVVGRDLRRALPALAKGRKGGS